MALTNERAEMLANYFNENTEERIELFGIEAANAVEQMNADGCDVTLEEFQEFAEAVEELANSSEGELDENSLDDVSGGIGGIINPLRWIIPSIPIILPIVPIYRNFKK